MGCQAQLAYGFSLGKEGFQFIRKWDSDPNTPSEDLDGNYVIAAGIVAPYDRETANDEWWNRYRHFAKECAVGIIFHGSGDDIVPFIYAKDSLMKSSGSETTMVDAENIFDVDGMWDEDLQNVCETLGIPYEKPGWFLTYSGD